MISAPRTVRGTKKSAKPRALTYALLFAAAVSMGAALLVKLVYFEGPVTMDNEREGATRTRVTGWTRTFDDDGNPQERYRHYSALFDSDRRKVMEEELAPSGAVIARSRFDERGNVQQEAHYDRDGSLERRVEYTYDQDGREIRRETYLRSGLLRGYCEHKYAPDGKLQESVHYDADGRVQVEDIYKYERSPEGEVVVKTRGSVAEWSSLYGRDGKLLSRSGGYFSGDEGLHLQFDYDDQGWLVEERALDHRMSLRSRTVYEREVLAGD